jgi:hypothetical protein
MEAKTKSYLAVAGGVVAGGVLTAILEMLSPHQAPASLDFADSAAVSAHVAAMPMSAWLYQLAVCFLGGLAAGAMANFIAKSTPYRPAMVAAIGLCIVNIMNFFMFAHPIWFMVASTLAYPLGGFIAGRIAAFRS